MKNNLKAFFPHWIPDHSDEDPDGVRNLLTGIQIVRSVFGAGPLACGLNTLFQIGSNFSNLYSGKIVRTYLGSTANIFTLYMSICV